MIGRSRPELNASDLESSTASRTLGDGYVPAVGREEPLDDSQAEPNAVFGRGEALVEHLLTLIGRDAIAVVLNYDPRTLAIEWRHHDSHRRVVVLNTVLKQVLEDVSEQPPVTVDEYLGRDIRLVRVYPEDSTAGTA